MRGFMPPNPGENLASMTPFGGGNAVVARVHAAAFTQGQLEDRGEEADICLQQFCASRGKKGLEAVLGKRAKKMYLEDHPGYQFPKKTIFAQGQMVEANRWTASMASYLERALEAL